MDADAAIWISDGWNQPSTQMLSYTIGRLAGIVTWPSGRQTREDIGGTAVITDMEELSARGESLRNERIANLRRSLLKVAQDTERGWLVRLRPGKKRHARRIASVDWIPVWTKPDPSLIHRKAFKEDR
jgi:hypothetical protein